jgi:hypothetical protein
MRNGRPPPLTQEFKYCLYKQKSFICLFIYGLIEYGVLALNIACIETTEFIVCGNNLDCCHIYAVIYLHIF